MLSQQLRKSNNYKKNKENKIRTDTKNEAKIIKSDNFARSN